MNIAAGLGQFKVSLRVLRPQYLTNYEKPWKCLSIFTESPELQRNKSKETEKNTVMNVAAGLGQL